MAKVTNGRLARSLSRPGRSAATMERFEAEFIRTERAFADGGRLCRAQFDGFPLPTYAWQRTGDDFILIGFNDAADEITKGNVRQSVGERATKMHADRPDIVRDINRCFRDRAVIQREMEFEFKLCRKKLVLNVSYAYVPHDLVVVYTEDITERKRTEQALKDSEEKYRLLVENASDVAYRFSLHTQDYEYLSPAVEKVFGYTPEEFKEITRKNIESLVHPDDYAAVRQRLDTRRFVREKNGFPRRAEYRVRHKDGHYVWVSDYRHVVRDEEGKAVAVEGIDRDITERKLAEEKLERSLNNVRANMVETIHILASAVEVRDPYTAGHQRRVADLCCAMAEEMGLPRDQIDGIRLAAIVHDIGKLHVPAEILAKPGRLTDTEFLIIKAHPRVGHEIVSRIEFPWPVARTVFQHHEKLDGSGYPLGISADEIILEARIICVADVVEAMASHRPYRPAQGLDKAMEEITRNRGVLYDSGVVDVCAKVVETGEFAFV